MMDRGTMRVVLNLGDAAVSLEGFRDYGMVLQSRDDICLESDTLQLPPSRLAVLSRQ
jgi:hypothetical protein